MTQSIERSPEEMLEELIQRYPALTVVKEQIRKAYALLEAGYSRQGKLLVCGNGGSAADALHIVGELMKSFTLERPLDKAVQGRLDQQDSHDARYLARYLQGALPAVALVENAALATAFANDVQSDLVFAQQVYGLGQQNDCLLCLSTSGNAENVCYAAHIAKARGMSVIGLSGGTGGKLAALCDTCIVVPRKETYQIQELHLPVYHTLCLMLEHRFFGCKP